MAFDKWFDDPRNELPDYTPDWLKRTGTMTLPQGAPGQLQSLASQLAMGGFGTAKDNMGWLDQVYDPVTVADFYNPDPKTVTKPTTTGTPGTRPTPYWVPTSTPMGGNSQTPWWKTSLVNDPTYLKVYGNSRKPPQG